jgi:predicted Zn-dependent protease
MMDPRASGWRRRQTLKALCACCTGAWGISAQAQAAEDQVVVPSERFVKPAVDTDEGGLWALMDREESKLKKSPFLIRSPELSVYLKGLACTLGGSHCPDIRVYPVRTPYFNASMAPNGVMQVWSGLLLRVENEAQLCAVLGHEIGHYVERHSLEQLRDLKSRAAFGQFLGMFGLVGSMAQLGVLAGSFAFSREHETRADRIGIQLMKTTGYEASEAVKVWANLLDELKIASGEDAGKKSPMFATHPPVETRMNELRRLSGQGRGVTGEKGLASAIAPFRLDWIRDEIKRGQYEESLVLFDRFIQRNASDAQMLFGRAEVRRVRGASQDWALALEDVKACVATGAAPVDVLRTGGLVLKQLQKKAEAIEYFESYLSRSPSAHDEGLIRHYIGELKS